MEIIQLSSVKMLLLYGTLILPLGLIAWLKLGILREIFIALLRMTLQLGLVGLYLKVIFAINAPLLNLAWILAMVVVATSAMLRQAGLLRRRFFAVTFGGTAFATATISCFFVMAILRPDPPYDARYLIPVFGMVLGNCMRGNVLSLERFYAGIRESEKEFVTYHMLGATLSEATRPFMRKALKAALAPHVSSMATMGIVSLPGMMTGQILGGSFPLTAIKYQIAICICIFGALVVAAVLNLFLSTRVAFDEYGMLRQEVFVK